MSGSSADAPKKKTTRTRATRGAVKEKGVKPASRGGVARTTKKNVSKKSAVQKTVPKKETAAAVVASDATSSDGKRRAPTSLGLKKARKIRGRNRWIVVGVLMVIGVGSSAAVGYTDTGYIDINEQILSQYSPEERANRTIPVQNTNPERKVDGGLRGLGTGGGDQERQRAETAAATTASTSLEMASSTATSTATTSDETSTSTITASEGGEEDADTARPADAPSTESATSSEATL